MGEPYHLGNEICVCLAVGGPDAGYRAIVLTDGTSTINDEWHNAGLNYALENIAERVTCAEAAAAPGG